MGLIAALNEAGFEEFSDFVEAFEDKDENDSFLFTAIETVLSSLKIDYIQPDNIKIFKLIHSNISVRNAKKRFHPNNLNLKVTKEQIKSARIEFHELCPSIFTNEQNEDGDLAILKAIDINNDNHGLLVLLLDTWNRYKIEHKMPLLPIFDFWNNRYKFAKRLKQKNGKILVDKIKNGLENFNKRLIQIDIPKNNK